MQTHNKDKIVEKEQQLKEPVKEIMPMSKWPAGLQFSKEEKLTVSIAKDLAVVLTHHAFEQLFGWAYATNREISCLGSIRRDGNKFIVEQFYLLKQTGSATSTELDQTAMAELMEKLLAEGKHEEARTIKCWVHSHPGMGVFWSGTDDETCKLMVSDYLVSIVVSDRFAIRCRIDIAAPVPMSIDHVPVLYEMQEDKELAGKYAQEVKDAVSERFFFFDEVDDGTNNKADHNSEDKTARHDFEYVPALYCNYCGMVHGEGECPLLDEHNMANLVDDEYYF